MTIAVTLEEIAKAKHAKRASSFDFSDAVRIHRSGASRILPPGCEGGYIIGRREFIDGRVQYQLQTDGHWYNPDELIKVDRLRSDEDATD